MVRLGLGFFPSSSYLTFRLRANQPHEGVDLLRNSCPVGTLVLVLMRKDSGELFPQDWSNAGSQELDRP